MRKNPKTAARTNQIETFTKIWIFPLQPEFFTLIWIIGLDGSRWVSAGLGGSRRVSAFDFVVSMDLGVFLYSFLLNFFFFAFFFGGLGFWGQFWWTAGHFEVVLHFLGGFWHQIGLFQLHAIQKSLFFCFFWAQKVVSGLVWGFWGDFARHEHICAVWRWRSAVAGRTTETQRLRRPKHETAHALASAHLLHQGRPDVWSRGSFGAVSKFWLHLRHAACKWQLSTTKRAEACAGITQHLKTWALRSCASTDSTRDSFSASQQ